LKGRASAGADFEVLALDEAEANYRLRHSPNTTITTMSISSSALPPSRSLSFAHVQLLELHQGRAGLVRALEPWIQKLLERAPSSIYTMLCSGTIQYWMQNAANNKRDRIITRAMSSLGCILQEEWGGRRRGEAKSFSGFIFTPIEEEEEEEGIELYIGCSR